MNVMTTDMYLRDTRNFGISLVTMCSLLSIFDYKDMNKP